MKASILANALLLAGLDLSLAEERDPYDNVARLKLSLGIPKEFETIHEFSPVTYLDMFTDEDVRRFTDANGTIKPECKGKLKPLFLAAYKSTLKKYRQTYFIGSKAAFIGLLTQVYPEISEIEKEFDGHDGSINIGDIADVLEKDRRQFPPPAAPKSQIRASKK